MPYVRTTVYGTIGLLDRPVTRGQRFFVADNPADDPPDRLLQQLLALHLVALDADQDPDRPAVAAPVGWLTRLRSWLHDRRARAALARMPVLVPEPSAAQPAAHAPLWLPGRPRPTVTVRECPQCWDASTCTHLR